MKVKSKKILIEQTRSVIGKNKQQRSIIKGLGLKRIGSKVTVENTLSFNGMIDKVKHMVKFTFVE